MNNFEQRIVLKLILKNKALFLSKEKTGPGFIQGSLCSKSHPRCVSFVFISRYKQNSNKAIFICKLLRAQSRLRQAIMLLQIYPI